MKSADMSRQLCIRTVEGGLWRGGTLREFILGAMIGPTAMCSIWFSVIGGSAILLEADGIAVGKTMTAPHAFRIYETIALMFDGPWATLMNVAVAVLLLLLIVGSSSAAIIAINSIGAAGGKLSETPTHSLNWAVAIAAVSFSGIMALMLATVLRLVWGGSRSGLGAAVKT